MATLLHAHRLDTPIGRLALLTRADALAGLTFGEDRLDALAVQLARWIGSVTIEPGPDGVAPLRDLAAYFDGDVHAIDGIQTLPIGTPFQRDVWAALRTISAAAPISYGELARRIGRPAAIRAVGAANGANPIAIVVPCHRVIASDGSLHGYGGGLDRKRWLLDHEARAVGRRLPLDLAP